MTCGIYSKKDYRFEDLGVCSCLVVSFCIRRIIIQIFKWVNIGIWVGGFSVIFDNTF